jgi:glycosyl transferase family 87
MLGYYLGLFMPRVREAHTASNLAGGYDFGHDFYPVWLTSRDCIHVGCDPYSPEMTRKIQLGLFGRTLDSRIPSDPPSDYRTFAYPAFTDLLLWPAAQFPFTTVRVVVALILAGLTVASVSLWMQSLSLHPAPSSLAAIVLLVLCSYPVLEGLYAGQLGLLVGFLLAASLLALQRGWPLLAGIIMALTAIKPQMTILAMVYLFIWSGHNWRDRGRFCIGLFSAVLVLCSAAVLVWPHWIHSWVRVIVGYHRYANLPLAAEIFHLGPNLGGTAVWGAIALALTLVVSWKKRSVPTSSVEFWLTLSLMLCITAVTLLPSQGFQDQVVLLPGIFLVSRQWQDLSYTRTYKVLLVSGAAVLLWPYFAAFGLIASRPLLTHQDFYSQALFVLPLRTAAAFPFVLLGVLALSLRHSRQSPL